MDEQQLETVGELVAEIHVFEDDPVYVRTPHGTYYFVVQGVERVKVEGERRTVIVVREVDAKIYVQNSEKKLPLTVLAYVENEYNRLCPFVGRAVQVLADDPRERGVTVQGYLTRIERFDTYVLCTVAPERERDHVQCVSARIRPVP